MNNIEEQLEQFQALKFRIREEGFHYCFMHYSRWYEIDDREFQMLRNDYCNISMKLEEYIDEKIKQLKTLTEDE